MEFSQKIWFQKTKLRCVCTLRMNISQFAAVKHIFFSLRWLSQKWLVETEGFYPTQVTSLPSHLEALWIVMCPCFDLFGWLNSSFLGEICLCFDARYARGDECATHVIHLLINRTLAKCFHCRFPQPYCLFRGKTLINNFAPRRRKSLSLSPRTILRHATGNASTWKSLTADSVFKMDHPSPPIRIVVIGSSKIGKSKLLTTVNKSSPENSPRSNSPTKFDPSDPYFMKSKKASFLISQRSFSNAISSKSLSDFSTLYLPLPTSTPPNHPSMFAPPRL